ncbi:hypothetical protein [Raoultella terrigena]|jgi:hypothetical protein
MSNITRRAKRPRRDKLRIKNKSSATGRVNFPAAVGNAEMNQLNDAI